MSWRVVYTNVDGESPDFSLPKCEEPENAERQLVSEEHQGQHALAVQAATDMIESGWVGKPSENKFRVEMGGHANTDLNGIGNSLYMHIYNSTA